MPCNVHVHVLIFNPSMLHCNKNALSWVNPGKGNFSVCIIIIIILMINQLFNFPRFVFLWFCYTTYTCTLHHNILVHVHYSCASISNVIKFVKKIINDKLIHPLFSSGHAVQLLQWGEVRPRGGDWNDQGSLSAHAQNGAPLFGRYPSTHLRSSATVCSGLDEREHQEGR